jgi:hypothetical protein
VIVRDGGHSSCCTTDGRLIRASRKLKQEPKFLITPASPWLLQRFEPVVSVLPTYITIADRNAAYISAAHFQLSTGE